MPNTNFDETKHPRHGKGSRQGGRFAPKPAPQPAAVAAPDTAPLWHMLLWTRKLRRYGHLGRQVKGGADACPNELIAIVRWTTTAATARDAVREGLREAAQRLGVPEKGAAMLDSGWEHRIVGLGVDSACACVPLASYIDPVFLQAASSPPAPNAAAQYPLSTKTLHRFFLPEILPEAEKLAAASGLGADAARAVSLAVQTADLRYEKGARSFQPIEACPDHPGLFLETLAHLGRDHLVTDTLHVLLTDPFRALGDDTRQFERMLMSGLYARALNTLPYDPFTLHSPASDIPIDAVQIMRSLTDLRNKNGMYRPHSDYRHIPGALVFEDDSKTFDLQRLPVGVALLKAAAAIPIRGSLPRAEWDLGFQHQADALAAAARRSEFGAVAAFATAMIVPPDEPPVKAALRQLLDDPDNRWCPPADFRRKIATLHCCSHTSHKTGKTSAGPGRRRHNKQHPRRAPLLKEASDMLNDTLTVVVGEPGEPVTDTEAECAHTLLMERGTLVNSGRIVDPNAVFAPAAPRYYSTLSRQQQLACAHHAQPELAIPDAARKLAARTGDYAKWATSRLGDLEAGRLISALLTAPDLPRRQVAGLYMLQDKHMRQAQTV